MLCLHVEENEKIDTEYWWMFSKLYTFILVWLNNFKHGKSIESFFLSTLKIIHNCIEPRGRNEKNYGLFKWNKISTSTSNKFIIKRLFRINIIHIMKEKSIIFFWVKQFGYTYLLKPPETEDHFPWICREWEISLLWIYTHKLLFFITFQFRLRNNAFSLLKGLNKSWYHFQFAIPTSLYILLFKILSIWIIQRNQIWKRIIIL